MNHLKISIILIVIIFLFCAVGYNGYKFGRHSASLQVSSATPMQIAEAMQGDHFYSDYPQTMLLVSGKVASVTKQHNDIIVTFASTSKPSTLQDVTCEFAQNVLIKKGETIRVLSVAYDAKRVHTTGVALQNCFLLNN